MFIFSDSALVHILPFGHLYSNTNNNMFKWQQGDSTHNHLFRKRALNHWAKLVSLAKWLSFRLRTKRLWVWIPLLLLKLQISCVSSKEFLDKQVITRCRFTLKRVRGMIITYRLICSFMQLLILYCQPKNLENLFCSSILSELFKP